VVVRDLEVGRERLLGKHGCFGFRAWSAVFIALYRRVRTKRMSTPTNVRLS